MIKRYGASVSPCSTPATMSKYSVSPSGERRKSTAKAKLKAANQQERIKLWKQHFENLLGNPPNVTHEPITRIISKQLDIKLGPFT